MKFIPALVLALIILKLCNIITWSWWWILAPIYVPIFIMLLLVILIGIMCIMVKIR